MSKTTFKFRQKFENPTIAAFREGRKSLIASAGRTGRSVTPKSVSVKEARIYRNARSVSTAFIYSSTGPFSGQQINKQNAQRARFIGGPLAERRLLEAARPLVPILQRSKL